MGSQYILSVYTVKENESGRPETTYVSGWEARNMGGELTATVTDLLPETEYRYSVRVTDPVSGMQSLNSNEVTVTTLEATFDYLRPELETGNPENGTCSATWTPVEGADDYLLSLYTKVYGEAETTAADFTGGVSAIPTGWECNSNLTYANANYCGEAVPSLRFNTDGQWLSTASYPEVRGIRFWARGVSASESAAIELYARGEGDWELVETWPVDNKSGQTYEGVATTLWPEGTSMLRILFRNGGKGSLALDDITVSYGGDITRNFFGDTTYFMTTSDTFALLTGLQPATTYWLTVTGRQGELLSKPSRERRIVTGESGMRDIASAGQGYSINGLSLSVTAPARLYSLMGVCVAAGEETLTAPAPGVYILSIEGNPVKIIIK